jgi:hypothetical protein
MILAMLRNRPVLATGVALLLGAVLRLSWGWDIEYKRDEAYTTNSALGLGNKVPWPQLGMRASVGIRNPGLSVWVFSALARVFDVHDPVGLARSVQLANVTALVALLWFALSLVPREEREPWLWATALAALCPVEIVYDRKIWAQSVFPIFCMLNWIAWWHRRRPVGAVLWGVIGAILGQIQMSGFFFGAALALWTAMSGRSQKDRVRWGYWFAGSLLGMIPLVPWLYYLWTLAPDTVGGGRGLEKLVSFVAQPKLGFRFRFWIYWVSFPLGLNLFSALGGEHFIDFLRYPLLVNRPTYGVLYLHLVCGLVGLRLVRLWLRAVWRDRQRWKAIILGRESETAFMVSSVLFGYGLSLAISSLKIFPHYLIIVFPMQYVWLSRLALAGGPNPAHPASGQQLLLVLCIAEFLMSVLFLYYIHVSGGAPGGDYGLSYRAAHGSW